MTIDRDVIAGPMAAVVDPVGVAAIGSTSMKVPWTLAVIPRDRMATILTPATMRRSLAATIAGKAAVSAAGRVILDVNDQDRIALHAIDPRGTDPHAIDPRGIDPQGIDPHAIDPPGTVHAVGRRMEALAVKAGNDRTDRGHEKMRGVIRLAVRVEIGRVANIVAETIVTAISGGTRGDHVTTTLIVGAARPIETTETPTTVTPMIGSIGGAAATGMTIFSSILMKNAVMRSHVTTKIETKTRRVVTTDRAVRVGAVVHHGTARKSEQSPNRRPRHPLAG